MHPRYLSLYGPVLLSMQASMSINLCDFESFNHGHSSNATLKMHLRFSIPACAALLLEQCAFFETKKNEETNHQNQALENGKKRTRMKKDSSRSSILSAFENSVCIAYRRRRGRHEIFKYRGCMHAAYICMLADDDCLKNIMRLCASDRGKTSAGRRKCAVI